MDSMDTRRKQIVELVNRLGYVRFIQIKENFPNVSEMTLRTDLKALDQEKKIVRIHGGAKSVQLVIGTDDYLNNRSIRNQDEKEEIAEKAAGLIKPDTAVFLDSGSTTTMLARLFPDQSNLIYTTGLSCATELAGLSEPTVLIPGGKLNRYSVSVYGTSVVKELEMVNFHQTFLGVMNFEYQTGFTCGNQEEAILKRTAIRQSEEVIVLMDSSKLDRKGTYSICGLDDIDILVSDGHLPPDFRKECRDHKVTVL
ncbi:MAG: DeoR/GlpR transcriptional regulator [Eubacterium sp.]|jgi:Transcriptional regulators of sugar metabolism|nr:DeoR/GlpR transcriptional regulator [Eubacterium sp.]